ncbi:MAG: NAD-dependent epimerase/dehydratase family protein [Rhizobiales bacterium]|nr:NAD-dependent epimerase/dehydratase family protein [Hyphomicrobiales bacterium]
MNRERSRVLLTGASGALGSHVLDALRVLPNPPEIGVITRSAAQAAETRCFTGDFLDTAFTRSVLRDFKPERVFHLAWETAHGSYWTSPANADWAAATLAFAHDYAGSGGHLTFAGTCAEYQWGGPLLTEDETEEAPHTLYGQEKQRTSRALLALDSAGRLSVNCSRLFFPFSERENQARITSLAVRYCLEGKPLHLRAGDVYRDMCHTRHVANALVRMSGARACGLYNMATGKPVHLGHFLQAVAAACGTPGLVSFDPWTVRNGETTEPEVLAGSPLRAAPYLHAPTDPTSDIAAFVAASKARFQG